MPRVGHSQALEPAQEVAAIERIRLSGLRVTSARIAVLRALAASETPLNPSQIHQAILADGGHIDMVSVYRVLTALADLELIHYVGSVDGFTACRLQVPHDSIVAHLLCRVCGRAQECSIDEDMAERVLVTARSSGFAPNEIRIEVMGDCAVCQTEAPL